MAYGRISLWGHLRAISQVTPEKVHGKKLPGMVGGHKWEDLCPRPTPGKNMRPYLKNKNLKQRELEGMAQVAECKHEPQYHQKTKSKDSVWVCPGSVGFWRYMTVTKCFGEGSGDT
jgi:hypothetical protein